MTASTRASGQGDTPWSWNRGTLRRPPPDNEPAERVVKVGGSLLAQSAWPEALAELLADLPAARRDSLPAIGPQPLVVVGGGRIVDGLRAIDAVRPREPSLMHELAIDAMSLTARLVADALDLPLVTRPDAGPGVLDVATWLRDPRLCGHLPAGWHVTSDSIAALLARHTGRDLVLVKSVPPPTAGDDLPGLAASGWVDGHFPAAAAGIAAIEWAAPA